MNDAGQVVFDGYGREHGAVWTPNTVIPASFFIMYPTVDNNIEFTSGTGGTTGATEPVWPTSPGQTVTDGTVTWTGEVERCDESDHSLVLNTGGVNSLLVAQGSAVGGSTVIGFG
jgi:hypothetical protein